MTNLDKLIIGFLLGVLTTGSLFAAFLFGHELAQPIQTVLEYF